MFISPALAQTAAQTPGTAGDATWMVAQLLLIIGIVYLLLIRPQMKRARQREMELNAIIVGTRVIVAGLVGKVSEIVDDKTLKVRFSDGVDLTVLRSYVSQVVFETPANAQKKG
ncbi:MAG: preprotein translocase subunit YajC [Alphaproteobacteria bacterium]|nr:preprotein translocase subunit YajC [Alphaproteobacteria bacterium]